MVINMEQYRIIKIAEHREMLLPGALWFHQKWGIPQEAYRESMKACAEGEMTRMYVHRK